MRRWTIGLVLALAVGPLLVGCGQEEQAAPAAEQESAGDTYSSTTLNTSYDDALNASTQLILGTIRLEETGDTVTAEQAKSLLPLWQSLQGGVTAQAEVNAVLKQIESTMTQDQLAAIAAMRLTQEDLRSFPRGRTVRQYERGGAGKLARNEGGRRRRYARWWRCWRQGRRRQRDVRLYAESADRATDPARGRVIWSRRTTSGSGSRSCAARPRPGTTTQSENRAPGPEFGIRFSSVGSKPASYPDRDSPRRSRARL